MMLKSKHKIEVYGDSSKGFFWRARFVGKGPMANKIVADGSEAYSTRWNAKRAARRIGRVLMFASVIDVYPTHTNGDYRG